MAEALDDGEFWLPSEFLTDDDIVMDRNPAGFRKPPQTGFFFPSEFPYESSPPLNSPVESLVGSESDEEDILAGLTRQMARSLLLESEYNPASAVFGAEKNKARVMSGSPQSPLCGLGSWSAGSGGGSSRGSPNGPSQVASPPETPLNVKDDAWDLLYAAAGQVVRMKLNDEGNPNPSFGRGGLMGGVVPHKPTQVPLAFKNPNVGCYPNPALTRQQIQANHFLQLKQQQQQQQQYSPVWERQVKQTHTQNAQQVLNGARQVGVGIGNGRYNRPLGLPPSAWPPLQSQHPQNGSGMRAVFLGGSGARRECSGTGVFLPRRNGIASDSRRKPACSTVLLPDRVVQALNRSFDDMGATAQPHPHHPQACYVGGLGVPVHGNPLLSHQHKRSFRPQPTINAAEVQLPQEWTY